MSPWRRFTTGAVAIFRRDLSVFLTYRIQVISIFASTLFSLTLFYYVSRLVQVEAFPSPSDYFAFVVVGLAVNQIFESSFQLPGTVRSELLTGTLERVIVSPFGIVSGIFAMVLFPLMMSIFTAILTLAAGVVIFGVDLHWPTVPLALPLGLLGCLSLTSFGILFASITLVFKQGAAGMSFVSVAVSLFSGVYFPVTLLPSWIEWVSYIQPFTPALDLMRHVLIDTPLRESAAIELAKLVGFTIVLLPGSAIVLRAAVGRARRTGQIIEY